MTHFVTGRKAWHSAALLSVHLRALDINNCQFERITIFYLVQITATTETDLYDCHTQLLFAVSRIVCTHDDELFFIVHLAGNWSTRKLLALKLKQLEI
jgi:type IV secretory pathway VirB3-like protein